MSRNKALSLGVCGAALAGTVLLLVAKPVSASRARGAAVAATMEPRVPDQFAPVGSVMRTGVQDVIPADLPHAGLEGERVFWFCRFNHPDVRPLTTIELRYGVMDSATNEVVPVGGVNAVKGEVEGSQLTPGFHALTTDLSGDAIGWYVGPESSFVGTAQGNPEPVAAYTWDQNSDTHVLWGHQLGAPGSQVEVAANQADSATVSPA